MCIYLLGTDDGGTRPEPETRMGSTISSSGTASAHWYQQIQSITVSTGVQHVGEEEYMRFYYHPLDSFVTLSVRASRIGGQEEGSKPLELFELCWRFIDRSQAPTSTFWASTMRSCEQDQDHSRRRFIDRCQELTWFMCIYPLGVDDGKAVNKPRITYQLVLVWVQHILARQWKHEQWRIE